MPNDFPRGRLTVELQILDPDWRGQDFDLEGVVRAALDSVLEYLSRLEPGSLPAAAMAELSIVLAEDELVRRLNKHYRDQDKPTNVLSFGDPESESFMTFDDALLLGDVVLARQTIEREALEQGKSIDHHVSHLVIHGFLHLLGFDHEDDREAEVMESIERLALARLNIADPYAAPAEWLAAASAN